LEVIAEMKTRRQFLGSGIAVVLAALLAPLLNRFKPRRTWSVVKSFGAQATQASAAPAWFYPVGMLTLRDKDEHQKVRQMLRIYRAGTGHHVVRTKEGTDLGFPFLYVHDLHDGKLVLTEAPNSGRQFTYSHPDRQWEAKLSA
jgi:hypothetical protein